MEEKGRGGKTALHILAFIGITLALLIVAALAALYITTRGPSEAARDNFVEWADSHGLGFAAGLFISDEVEDGILNPPSVDGEQPEPSSAPLITVSGEAPVASASPTESPETSAAPETSAEPEASPAPSDNGEEAEA